MADVTCKNLGEATWAAIECYAKMAGWLTAPEAFVQSSTAMQIHQDTGCRVSIELPIRTLLYDWHVDRSSLQGLGNFRVDLAAYESNFDKNKNCLTALVEFKLWTNRFQVANDVRRVKQIIRALGTLEDNSKKINGYVVVCSQYHQGVEAVTGAVVDFRQRFPLCYERLGTIKPANDVVYGVGVAVIDVHQCVEGEYG